MWLCKASGWGILLKEPFSNVVVTLDLASNTIVWWFCVLHTWDVTWDKTFADLLSFFEGCSDWQVETHFCADTEILLPEKVRTETMHGLRYCRPFLLVCVTQEQRLNFVLENVPCNIVFGRCILVCQTLFACFKWALHRKGKQKTFVWCHVVWNRGCAQKKQPANFLPFKKLRRHRIGDEVCSLFYFTWFCFDSKTGITNSNRVNAPITSAESRSSLISLRLKSAGNYPSWWTSLGFRRRENWCVTYFFHDIHRKTSWAIWNLQNTLKDSLFKSNEPKESIRSGCQTRDVASRVTFFAERYLQIY